MQTGERKLSVYVCENVCVCPNFFFGAFIFFHLFRAFRAFSVFRAFRAFRAIENFLISLTNISQIFYQSNLLTLPFSSQHSIYVLNLFISISECHGRFACSVNQQPFLFDLLRPHSDAFSTYTKRKLIAVKRLKSSLQRQVERDLNWACPLMHICA